MIQKNLPISMETEDFHNFSHVSHAITLLMVQQKILLLPHNIIGQLFALLHLYLIHIVYKMMQISVQNWQQKIVLKLISY